MPNLGIYTLHLPQSSGTRAPASPDCGWEEGWWRILLRLSIFSNFTAETRQFEFIRVTRLANTTSSTLVHLLIFVTPPPPPLTFDFVLGCYHIAGETVQISHYFGHISKLRINLN